MNPEKLFFDQTPAAENYSYLRPEGTITFSIDRKYNVLVADTQFDGWFEKNCSLLAKGY